MGRKIIAAVLNVTAEEWRGIYLHSKNIDSGVDLVRYVSLEDFLRNSEEIGFSSVISSVFLPSRTFSVDDLSTSWTEFRQIAKKLNLNPVGQIINRQGLSPAGLEIFKECQKRGIRCLLTLENFSGCPPIFPLLKAMGIIPKLEILQGSSLLELDEGIADNPFVFWKDSKPTLLVGHYNKRKFWKEVLKWS